MANNYYDEITILKDENLYATTPKQLDIIIQKCAQLIPQIANPRLQTTVLEVLKSATEKYIKIRAI